MGNCSVKPLFSFLVKSLFLVLMMTIISGCNNGDNTVTTPPDANITDPYSESMYFPPIDGSVWETRTISNLDWNASAVQPLKDYLAEKHTKSFMILVNGRIVMEEYMNGHTNSDTWQWNSAGKTLVSSMSGIAQQEGLLNINNKASDYLGTGWTSEPLEKENLITLRHLLTMTSGINDENDLVVKRNLTYLADAGTRWSYSNVFQILMDVVAASTNQGFETYFDAKLKNKIGMEGFWNYGAIFTIYHSNTRSMARFGLLALNKGKWGNEQIINENYFNESITTSQSINPSYGYLWWLNGKTSYMVPGGQTVFQGPLVPNAPSDMYSAMGAEDQRIYVIPSKKMVIIRMGDASDPANPSFALSGFDTALWDKINALIN
ncbi:MAG: serine hydrolase [Sulfuricurvum sp.]|uniref:serine hydrolase domain-containing protein n=1 Tax=Sulfuricurvum sp. TaxID=2025608 RepID=UPI002621D6D7|nr:serine hydrolase [Sulfuricurvum sp.]MDD2829585.1 serine hydrolase [Sulfuricurvum sp.]MDD4950368.1 serine hydrolase [Sulfuricurvum sp.]